LRGFSLEAGSLLSRAGRWKVSIYFAMLSSYKDFPAHQNAEENINKNVKSKPFLSQAITLKIWSERNQHLKMCILWNQWNYMCA